ncbi:hypothetical protein EVC45_42005 [Paraburkholderia sp. UYCP14C]|nr:hypothetical protein EVC45_42005 [Paraburkholderia sp. UYCP14C]
MPAELEPEPVPVDLAKAHDTEPVEHAFHLPATGHMVDLLIKGRHEGSISVEDARRAQDAWMCNKPLPGDLIEAVLAAS